MSGENMENYIFEASLLAASLEAKDSTIEVAELFSGVPDGALESGMKEVAQAMVHINNKYGSPTKELLYDFFDMGRVAKSLDPLAVQACRTVCNTAPRHSLALAKKHVEDVTGDYYRKILMTEIEVIFNKYNKRIPAEDLKGLPENSKFTHNMVFTQLSALIDTAKQATLHKESRVLKDGDRSSDEAILKGINEEKTDWGSTCLFWGVDRADELTHGISSGEVAVVGAPTSEGKSTFTRFMAAQSLLMGKNGIYVTLEMDELEVNGLITCAMHNTAPENPQLDWRNRGNFSKEEKKSLQDSMSRFSELREKGEIGEKAIVSETSFTISKLRLLIVNKIAELEAQNKKLHWVIVDYVGLMEHNIKRGELKTYAVERTYNAIHEMALEYSIAFAIPHQISREGQVHRDKTGFMETRHLADSSGTERAVDYVLLLSMNNEDRKSKLTKFGFRKTRSSARIDDFKLESRLASGMYMEPMGYSETGILEIGELSL